MKHSNIRTALLLSAGIAAVASTATLSGYSLSGRTWATSSVLFYVNPQNVGGLTQTAIVDALKRAADGWRNQTHANVELVYAGTTSGASFGLNYKNEVFFRNVQSTYGAETYWWYDGSGRLVDFDTGFYEGTTPLVATPGACVGAAIYLDDLAIHEFGHGLGLDHSSVLGATMQPIMPSYCDTTQMTLEADDVAGVERAYPAAAVVSTPSAPSLQSVAVNASNPTSSLVVSWADNSGNESGFRVERSTDGSNFTQVSQPGSSATSYTNSGLTASTTYYYRVYAYNSAGNSPYSGVISAQTAAAAAPPPASTPPPAATPPPPPPAATPTATLTLRGYKVKSTMKIDVMWTAGIVGSKVDVFRNGSKLTTTGNDGIYTNTPSKSTATFIYKVCLAGKASPCTNTATISY